MPAHRPLRGLRDLDTIRPPFVPERHDTASYEEFLAGPRHVPVNFPAPLPVSRQDPLRIGGGPDVVLMSDALPIAGWRMSTRLGADGPGLDAPHVYPANVGTRGMAREDLAMNTVRLTEVLLSSLFIVLAVVSPAGAHPADLEGFLDPSGCFDLAAARSRGFEGALDAAGRSMFIDPTSGRPSFQASQPMGPRVLEDSL
jgi:hypothetical protein